MARRVRLVVGVALADGLDVLAGIGFERSKRDALGFATVLDARLGQVVQDRLLEARRVCLLGRLSLAERLVADAPSEGERAVRAQALDGERPGDADRALILVR